MMVVYNVHAAKKFACTKSTCSDRGGVVKLDAKIGRGFGRRVTLEMRFLAHQVVCLLVDY